MPTYGYDPGWTQGLGDNTQHQPRSLEQTLASIPGLASYIAYGQLQRSQKEQETTDKERQRVRDILDRGGDINELAKTPSGLGVAKTLLELHKQQQDAALGAQLVQGGGANWTPEQWDTLAQKLALGNHPGAATVATIAQKKRAEAENQTALYGMKSAPAIPPDPQEASQSEDYGTPPVPTVPARPGAAAILEPGALRTSLQAQINAGGGGMTAKDLYGRIDTAAAQQATAKQAQLDRIALVGARGENSATPKIVADENSPTKWSWWDVKNDRLLATGAPAPSLNLAGGRESVYITRMIQGSNQAAKDLANVVQLPLTVSTGVLGGRRQGPGLFDAGREVLANKATSQEAQAYNAMATGFQRSLAQIESAGLMPSGSLTHQMDAVLFKEGDTNLTKLHKLAQTRQIIESGLEVITANPRVSPEEKQKSNLILQSIQKSVPFTHSDLIQLQEAQRTDPNATLGGILRAQKASNGGWSIRPR